MEVENGGIGIGCNPTIEVTTLNWYPVTVTVTGYQFNVVT